MIDPAATLGAARRAAAKRLAAELGADATPALDARLLIAGALGLAPDRLVLAEDRALSEAEIRAIYAVIERRIAGEPVARILGEKEFWGLTFQLADATLVPRPDTETLVEATLAWIDRAHGRDKPLRIVDIGTGSGAILIALLSELPRATGLGVDLSEQAARAARANAERLGVADRSLFIRGSWGESSAPADVIVSNPPYIRSGVIQTLDREVRDHDPMMALDGGDDGLDAYRAIAADLDRMMRPDGAAFFEIGFDQGQALVALAAQAGFEAVVHADLAGHDRVVELHRSDRSQDES